MIIKLYKKGFTLVELLVYVGIFSVVSGLMVGIMTTTLKVNQRESASAEATSQLNFVLQTIQRLVRESSVIIVNSTSTDFDNDATLGTSQTRLVLRMKDSNSTSTDRDPIAIYAENGAIKLSEGGGARISDLTNSRVLADNLQFTKYAQYPGHDTVAVDVQLTYNSDNPASRVSRSLRTAIARVSAATFDSNLLPGADNQYEIGYSSNQRWKNISISNLLNLGTSNTDIVGAQNGSLYYNSSSTKFRGYANGSWTDIGSSQWTTSSTAIYYNGGNVGIGTTSPYAKLAVVGDIVASGGTITGSTIVATSSFSAPYFTATSATATSTFAGGLTVQTDKFVVQQSSGRVGFGISSPSFPVDFQSQATFRDLTYFGSGQKSRIWDDGSNFIIQVPGSDRNLAIGVNSGASAPTNLVINGISGNVGIGTANPQSKLEVAGTIHSTSGGFKFPDGTTQASAAGINAVENELNINISTGATTYTSTGVSTSITPGPSGKVLVFLSSVINYTPNAYAIIRLNRNNGTEYNRIGYAYSYSSDSSSSVSGNKLFTGLSGNQTFLIEWKCGGTCGLIQIPSVTYPEWYFMRLQAITW